MFLSEEIDDLHDDGFEGSKTEHCIFTEVFFGQDIGRTSNRCLVTGMINFECESSKNTDAALSPNSENSVVTSHSSPKSTCLEEFYSATKEIRETSGPGFSLDRSAMLDRNVDDAAVKRMKFSADELPNTKPGLGKVTSGPASNSISETVTFRLVESSSQGVTSSCYLFKQHAELNKPGVIGDPDVSRCRLPNSSGDDRKEVCLSKAIASPVSHENFSARLLAASPLATVMDKSRTPLPAEGKPNRFESPVLDVRSLIRSSSRPLPSSSAANRNQTPRIETKFSPSFVRSFSTASLLLLHCESKQKIAYPNQFQFTQIPRTLKPKFLQIVPELDGKPTNPDP